MKYTAVIRRTYEVAVEVEAVSKKEAMKRVMDQATRLRANEGDVISTTIDVLSARGIEHRLNR